MRFISLTLDYWHIDILTVITKGMDISICIDQTTITKDLGMFVRILIEVDFGFNSIHVLTIERTDVSYKIEVASHCRLVGHMLSECRDTPHQ